MITILLLREVPPCEEETGNPDDLSHVWGNLEHPTWLCRFILREWRQSPHTGECIVILGLTNQWRSIYTSSLRQLQNIGTFPLWSKDYSATGNLFHLRVLNRPQFPWKRWWSLPRMLWVTWYPLSLPGRLIGKWWPRGITRRVLL